MVQFDSFTGCCPVFSTPFIEEASLVLMNSFSFCLSRKLDISQFWRPCVPSCRVWHVIVVSTLALAPSLPVCEDCPWLLWARWRVGLFLGWLCNTRRQLLHEHSCGAFPQHGWLWGHVMTVAGNCYVKLDSWSEGLIWGALVPARVVHHFVEGWEWHWRCPGATDTLSVFLCPCKIKEIPRK